jgi:hypothetical protein
MTLNAEGRSFVVDRNYNIRSRALEVVHVMGAAQSKGKGGHLVLDLKVLRRGTTTKKRHQQARCMMAGD